MALPTVETATKFDKMLGFQSICQNGTEGKSQIAEHV